MVKLNEDYFVDVNGTNYILTLDKHKVDKKGEQVTETIGYYTSLAGAIKSAAEDCIRRKLEVGSCDLSEAVKLINETNDAFAKLLEEKVGVLGGNE